MATRSRQESSGNTRPGLTPVSLFLILLLFWTITQAQLVLVLGLLALLLGTILEGPVQFFQERKFPRPAAILAVYVMIIGGLVLLIVAIAPGIADQASDFSEDVPAQLRELRDDWRGSGNGLLSGPGVGVLDRAIETVEGDADVPVSQSLVDRVIPVVTSITGGIISTVTLLVMTFYYLLEKRLIRGLIIETISPRHRDRVDNLWTEVEDKVGGWMRGQLLLCLIIGSIATVAYGIIDLEFWPLLGLWAGITEIIPIIGPWIGGVPAVLMALTVGWEVAVITTLVIMGMQGLENWVLVPRVMKGAVGLTPLTVFVAILAGTQLMGVVGAVLAIPIAATIQVILTDFLERRESRDERLSARSGWRWMLSRSGLRDIDPDDDHGAGAFSSRPATSSNHDDEAYTAQQESESFTMHRVDDEGEQGTEGEGDIDATSELDDAFTGWAPERRDASSESESGKDTRREPDRDTDDPGDVGDENQDTPDDPKPADDSPAYAAWPRTGDKDRRGSPSSTWPPLEEGRPERSRRKRRYRDS